MCNEAENPYCPREANNLTRYEGVTVIYGPDSSYSIVLYSYSEKEIS